MGGGRGEEGGETGSDGKGEEASAVGMAAGSGELAAGEQVGGPRGP